MNSIDNKNEAARQAYANASCRVIEAQGTEIIMKKTIILFAAIVMALVLAASCNKIGDSPIVSDGNDRTVITAVARL